MLAQCCIGNFRQKNQNIQYIFNSNIFLLTNKHKMNLQITVITVVERIIPLTLLHTRVFILQIRFLKYRFIMKYPICQKQDVFAPPSFFSNNFFLKFSKHFSFTPVFPPLLPYIRAPPSRIGGSRKFRKFKKSSSFLSGTAFPPPPSLVAGPLKKNFFCGFPYQCQSVEVNDNVRSSHLPPLSPTNRKPPRQSE